MTRPDKIHQALVSEEREQTGQLLLVGVPPVFTNLEGLGVVHLPGLVLAVPLSEQPPVALGDRVVPTRMISTDLASALGLFFRVGRD
jgi:hypothetical protein